MESSAASTASRCRRAAAMSRLSSRQRDRQDLPRREPAAGPTARQAAAVVLGVDHPHAAGDDDDEMVEVAPAPGSRRSWSTTPSAATATSMRRPTSSSPSAPRAQASVDALGQARICTTGASRPNRAWRRAASRAFRRSYSARAEPPACPGSGCELGAWCASSRNAGAACCSSRPKGRRRTPLGRTSDRSFAFSLPEHENAIHTSVAVSGGVAGWHRPIRRRGRARRSGWDQKLTRRRDNHGL